MFAPYDFFLSGDMDYKKLKDSYKEELYQNFINLYNKYISKGYNIVIREMGNGNC